MLSSRGALTVDAVICEALVRPVNGGRVLPIPSAQRVWAAIGGLVRAQLLLGHAVAVPKVCAFWTRQRHVVTEGPVCFFVREVCFGFSPAFATTYGLGPAVPLEDPRRKAVRLPIDIVAVESRVPADVVAAIVSELFRFIGEGLFSGKTFQITVPGVLELHAKRERATANADPALTAELFAIDSRRWPPAVRALAAALQARGGIGADQSRPRPQSARPTSNRRSLSRCQPPNASQPPAPDPRPLFVTALPRGKDFAEIAATAVREVRHRPRLPGSKRPDRPATATTDSVTITDAPVDTADADADAAAESVYEVLSPGSAMAAPQGSGAPVPPLPLGHTATAHGDDYDHDYCCCPPWARGKNNNNNAGALLPVGDRMAIPIPVEMNDIGLVMPLTNQTNAFINANNVEQNTAPKRCKVLFPWEGDSPDGRTGSAAATLRFGRRRFNCSTPRDNVRGILVDENNWKANNVTMKIK